MGPGEDNAIQTNKIFNQVASQEASVAIEIEGGYSVIAELGYLFKSIMR